MKATCLAPHSPGNARRIFGFASVFGDSAVLQRDRVVLVFGYAPAGTHVEVGMPELNLWRRRTASAAGAWRVELPPQPSGGPYQLCLRCGDDCQTLEDIWIGEVWIASGQSNMEWPLETSEGLTEARAAPNRDVRWLRLPGSLEPYAEAENASPSLTWYTAEAETVAQCPAIAYHFADTVQRALGCKVAFLANAYGGSRIEAWLPLDFFRSSPEWQHLAEAVDATRRSPQSKEFWEAQMERFSEWYHANVAWRIDPEGPEPQAPELHPGNPCSQSCPGILYESMLRPLLGYTARGVLWYQGESNTGAPANYEILFRALISVWREQWQCPEWPFYFVQLAGHAGLGDWPGLRAAQTRVRDTTPGTGMALALDCGDRHDIHPRDKAPVGERLARLALAQTYGQATTARGPVFQQCESNEDGFRISFDYAGSGLRWGSDLNEGVEAVGGDAAFEIEDSEGRGLPAVARIVSPNTVRLHLTHPQPQHAPCAIRYAWKDWIDPHALLYNSEGLPAEPFRQKL